MNKQTATDVTIKVIKKSDIYIYPALIRNPKHLFFVVSKTHNKTFNSFNEIEYSFPKENYNYIYIKLSPKELKQIGLNVWKYLSEHECSKDLLPDDLWVTIKNLPFLCPLCLLYYHFTNLDSSSCARRCPIIKYTKSHLACFIMGSSYDKWDHNDYETKYSKEIYEAIKQWRVRQ